MTEDTVHIRPTILCRMDRGTLASATADADDGRAMIVFRSEEEAERLLELGSGPEIVKCALTFEDIERYSLPPDFTKTTDTRTPAFVARYGDVAVELDALPRNVLRERLTGEVEHRMDVDALERTRAEERTDKERLDELLGE